MGGRLYNQTRITPPDPFYSEPPDTFKPETENRVSSKSLLVTVIILIITVLFTICAFTLGTWWGGKDSSKEIEVVPTSIPTPTLTLTPTPAPDLSAEWQYPPDPPVIEEFQEYYQ